MALEMKQLTNNLKKKFRLILKLVVGNKKNIKIIDNDAIMMV